MPEYLGRAVFALTASVVALLAGCAKDASTGTAPRLPAKTSPPPVTATMPAAPATNEHGLIPKTLGQEAGITDEKGADAATFSIDSITVDPPCYEYGTKPDAGHTLVLNARVAIGDDPNAASYMAGMLNPFNFAELGADGVTRDAQPGSCTDFTKGLTSEFGINQKYAGTIEVVVPEANGALALRNGTAGWEWRY